VEAPLVRLAGVVLARLLRGVERDIATRAAH